MVPHYTLILRILITFRIRPYRIGELGVYGHPPTVSRVQGIVVADINRASLLCGMRPPSSLFVVFECTTNDDEATTLDFFYEAEDDILPTFGADYLDAISWGTWYPNAHSAWGH